MVLILYQCFCGHAALAAEKKKKHNKAAAKGKRYKHETEGK
jgi:hypothetical protein